jgi:peptidyl-dipeptidase Dcp
MREFITRSLVLLFATAIAGLLMVNFVNNANGIKALAGAGHNNQSDSATNQNPLVAKWEGSFGGVPPFDRVQVSLFKPALEAAMAEQLAEIEKIATNAAAADFENTIAALERSGRTLNRVQTVYAVWGSTMSGPDFQIVQREMAPRLAAFSDRITQNEPLFKRIEAVYNSPEKTRLTPEQQRLAWLYYTNFVRAGARLNAEAKGRLSQINQKLAELYTRFSQNVLAEETDQFIALKTEADLAGLSPSVRDAAAAAAIAKKLPGEWVIMNTRSSIDPFLTYSDRRDLREKAWRMFVNRGDNGGERDNNAIITEILQLRAERAKLLGFATHAHWRLENAMAKTPERAMELMEAVWKPAVARVHEEVADMQALADKEGAKLKIEPWDYRYYAEKVRAARYDLDQNEVSKYLQLEKLREGIFWVAGELFGFNFTPATNVPVYHADVRVWEVTDKATKKHIGLWFFDPYARAGKRSGAWMNAYRSQQRVDGVVTTIVSNNANFVKGKPGEPLLISWDDAVTMFHEFGHALHGLNSNVTYPSLSGTAVARDYVEFPSQLLEHWLPTPEVLKRFALHYQTGKPIPEALVERIKRSSTFNQGFATTEYLSSALVDMKLHLAGDRKIDPDTFERETLAQLGMPNELVMRHRTPQFSHVFSSDAYSAGYYSYLWSDVLTADAFGAFVEAGGPYDRKVAERLRKTVFSVGNSVDPAEGYRAFRGRDPRIDALMKKRGFPIENGKS